VWLGGGFVQVAGIQHIQRAASIPGVERVAALGGALGLGAALSTWWLNTHGRARSPARVLGVGMILAAAWLVCLALSRLFAVFVGASFLIGACIAPAFVLTEMLLQEGADVRQRGRVFSLRDFAMRSTLLVSLALATLLTPLIGTGPTLIVAGALMAGAGGLAIVWGRAVPKSTGAGASSVSR
jgi:hypothetical protein